MAIRSRQRRQQAATPSYEEIPQEDGNVYLTLDGSLCQRLVCSFVKKGDVIVAGETVCVGPMIAALLLRRTQTDSRTSEEVSMWRYADQDEIDEFKQGIDTTDLSSADESKLAELAREEALNRGDVNPQTEEASQIQKQIIAQRQPAARRSRRAASNE